MKEFDIAKENAMKLTHRKDYRDHLFGAVGRRKDGTLVTARNIHFLNKDYKDNYGHAEERLVRKLDYGSTVWVVRISVTDGRLKPAKPCKRCENDLRLKGVKKVYYSISENEYGILKF